jgi:pectate lyase
MAFLMLCFTSFLHLPIASPLQIDAATLQRRRMVVGQCGSGNPVDDCWRCDPSWADNRQRLADCVVGFGRAALGGKNGKTYVVTDPSRSRCGSRSRAT